MAFIYILYFNHCYLSLFDFALFNTKIKQPATKKDHKTSYKKARFLLFQGKIVISRKGKKFENLIINELGYKANSFIEVIKLCYLIAF